MFKKPTEWTPDDERRNRRLKRSFQGTILSISKGLRLEDQNDVFQAYVEDDLLEKEVETLVKERTKRELRSLLAYAIREYQASNAKIADLVMITQEEDESEEKYRTYCYFLALSYAKEIYRIALQQSEAKK